MKKIFPYIVILTLAVSTLACSFSVNAPEISTGEIQTFTVNEAVPASTEDVTVAIEMGAGRLNVSSGAQSLVEGTITYNVFGWEPEIARENNRVRIHQGSLDEIKIPNDNVVNDWDLNLGDTPIALEISAGAYEGKIDLTGVPLTNLSISDGASKASVEINEVNPAEMDTFAYKTGASEVKIYGIANANADQFTFDGGAGDFTLDFTGTLQRDLNVNIDSGVSSIKIIIPDGVAADVVVSGGLNNISPKGTWTINGSTYSKPGNGPAIHIIIDMGVGSLDLINQ